MDESCHLWLELLEERLPPGDTLLGLLAAGILLNSTLLDTDSIIAPDPNFEEIRLAGAERSQAPDEHRLPAHPIRGFEDSAPATLNEYVATSQSSWPRWPRTLAAANPQTTLVSVNSNESLATWPQVSTLVPGSAMGRLNPAAAGLAAMLSRPNPGILVAPESMGRESMPPTSEGTDEAASRYGQLPFYFEQNAGQADESLDFVARGAGYTLGLSATEAVMVFPRPSEPRPLGSGVGLPPVADAPGSQADAPGSEGVTVRMQLLGGNPSARAAGVSPLPTKVNYFLGNDPDRWHTNISTFERVQYDDVYPGIDLVYYSYQQQLEYDFIVAPGADPDPIGLSFNGVDAVEIDPAGNLVLQAGDTQIQQQKPYIYQEINGTRQEVAGEFRIQNPECGSKFQTCSTHDSSLITFDLGSYDPSRPLVIDPQVVSYSTYLGGPGYDYGYDIAVDQFGSAYVAGEASPGFPLVNPVQQFGGFHDAFVSKFSPDGSTLVYSTYIGGTYLDSASSVAVDSKGGAYITGFTESNDFPTTQGAFDRIIGNNGTCTGDDYCADAFVVRLSPDGGSLGYSTFLGGGLAEAGHGIAVDAADNAYVMGQTNSADFPTLNAVQPTYGGDGGCSEPSYHYCFDAFITKLNPAGSALVYSTYLGGNQDEAYFFNQTGDIAIDPAGHAYVTGYTDSPNFPTYNAIQPTKYPGRDAYVTKLSPDGSAFVYSTFLGGGESGEHGFGIAADSAGNGYVTGVTHSGDFPTTPGSFQPVKNGDGDAFVSKLNPDGSAFVYSTFLGGAKNEEADAVLVDAAGNAYVTGWTYSLDFPMAKAFQPNHAEGNTDAFVTKLTPGGDALVFSSYLGGSGPNDDGNDGGHGLGLDSSGNLYVGGTTGSTRFPTVKPFQAQNAGKTDAFVTKISRYIVEQPKPKPL